MQTHVGDVDAALLAHDDPVVDVGREVVAHVRALGDGLVTEPRERRRELEVEDERAALVHCRRGAGRRELDRGEQAA